MLTEGYWYVATFWHEMGNSLYIGVATAALTLVIGTLTSFVIGRMRLRNAWMVSNAALLTYVIPMSFLAIPFYRVMQGYGLADNLWAVIFVEVTFATPYAIFIFRNCPGPRQRAQVAPHDAGCGRIFGRKRRSFGQDRPQAASRRPTWAVTIFQQYATSIPIELDEAARLDGATPLQLYLRIYLPLMAPAMVAVGTYALLLAWNEYLYLFLLLTSQGNMTVPVALGQFLNSDEAPWNLMMATAVIYAIPRIVIYYAFRRHMSAGLTMGGVKG